MGKALIIVGKIWLVVAGGFIALNARLIWYFEGFAKVAEIFSPFNVINLVRVLITLAPDFGLIMAGERVHNQRRD